MLYFVQPGDTLWSIARKFGTTMQALLRANVICNPNLIFTNQPLLIPTPGLTLPKAGGTPYYIVRPGDTLWCLAQEFNTSIPVLTAINNIANPNLIYPSMELLIGSDIPNARQLQMLWEQTAENCEELNPLQIYGIYYLGTFQWAALRRQGIPTLLNLLQNSCEVVRYYAALSLGRIGLNDQVSAALTNMLNDPVPSVAAIARLAIQRINIVQSGSTRIHLTTASTPLLDAPSLDASSLTIPEGTEVIVQTWFIPSPTGEEGPRGDIQIYDLVQLVRTGRIGFIARVGFNQIELI